MCPVCFLGSRAHLFSPTQRPRGNIQQEIQSFHQNIEAMLHTCHASLLCSACKPVPKWSVSSKNFNRDQYLQDMLKALKSEISSEVISFPPNSKRVCFQNWNFHRCVNEFAPDAKISNGDRLSSTCFMCGRGKTKKEQHPSNFMTQIRWVYMSYVVYYPTNIKHGTSNTWQQTLFIHHASDNIIYCYCFISSFFFIAGLSFVIWLSVLMLLRGS